MLTAKTEIDDRVAGLDAGADDYLTKPFAMKEFLARVRAMTRRKTVYAARKLKFGDFSLDSENFELACENSMRLSVKEFELLQTLVLNSDHEVDTDYLLEHVWEGVDNADGETVWLYISYLRGKLKSIASNVLIEGERDGNYRLVTEG
jgi:DNA-binding response OmpR family regulator